MSAFTEYFSLAHLIKILIIQLVCLCEAQQRKAAVRKYELLIVSQTVQIWGRVGAT